MVPDIKSYITGIIQNTDNVCLQSLLKLQRGMYIISVPYGTCQLAEPAWRTVSQIFCNFWNVELEKNKPPFLHRNNNMTVCKRDSFSSLLVQLARHFCLEKTIQHQQHYAVFCLLIIQIAFCKWFHWEVFIWIEKNHTPNNAYISVQ